MRRKGSSSLFGTKTLFLLAAVLLAVAFVFHHASAQSTRPKASKPGPDVRLVIGTLKPGSGLYSCSLALSQLINQYTNLKVIVQPYPVQTHVFPYIKSGAVQLTVIPIETLEAYAFGIKTLSNPEDKPAYPTLRMLMGGNYMYIGWVARSDTGIKTIGDLKGHKVFWKSVAALSVATYAEDSLRAYGLDPDKDVNSVLGYENIPAAYKALQTRKIDALFGVIGGGQMEEAEAVAGVVVLPFPEEKLKTLQISTKKVVQVPAKYLPGIKEPTSVLVRQLILPCREDLPDEAAYLIVKTLVEHHQEAVSIVPELKEWGKEHAMPTLSNIVIPFHPGAIKYFKEIGLWTPQIEEHHKELLVNIKKVKP